jgi:hypothetical protein
VTASQRGTAIAVGGLVLLVVLEFADVVFGGRIFYARDINQLWFGQMETLVRSVSEGAWPLWDPTLSFGTPLLANPNNQVFYPFTWLNLVLRPWHVFTLLVVTHLVVSGAGLFRLLRSEGRSPWASWVGSACWTVSGPLLSSVVGWNHFTALAWLPWAVFFAADGFRTGRSSRAAACGACLAAQVLAGSPDVLAVTALAIAIEAASTLEWRRDVAASRALHLVVAAGLGAALSAAQWLPSLELALNSRRSHLPWAVRTYWSTHPWNLVQALFPVPLSDLPLSADWRAQLFEGRDPYLHSLYLGLGALLIAARGYGAMSPRQRACVAALAAAGVLLALGRYTPVYALVSTLVPPVRILRYPMKAFVLTSFAVARVVGSGMDATGRGRPRWALAPIALAWAALLFVRLRPETIGAWLAPAPGDSPLSVLLSPTAWALASCALAATAVWILGGAPIRRWTTVAAGLVAIADLAIVNRSVNPSAPQNLFDRPPPTLALFAGAASPRLFSWDYARLPFPPAAAAAASRLPPGPRDLTWAVARQVDLLPPTPSRWGIRGSFDADVVLLSPDHIERLDSAFVRGSPAEQQRLLEIGGVDFVLALHREGLETLAALGERPSLHGAPLFAFRVSDALPRAYAVGEARAAPDDDALRLLLDPSFDIRRTIVVPDDGSADGRPIRATARILEARSDRVRVEAEVEGDGFVVLLDTYDPAWAARVDGRPERVRRANVAFMAVRVPAGRHVVELAYRPRSLYLGLVLSALALVAIGAMALRHRPWNRHAAQPAADANR